MCAIFCGNWQLLILVMPSLLSRGAALDNFGIDANRVQRYLDEHAGPGLQGVAIFACNSHQLFEVIETGVPFDNQVALEPVPDLLQLARLVDEQETAVVALVDTNTARLFVTRSGFLEEVAGPDDDPFGYRKRNMGGLNHKRYQRRIENKREAFAREAAAALEELVTHEGARRVILAGDAVALPLLHQALSPLLEPLIHEEILRLDIRTPRNEALSEIAPILTQVEEEESHARADRLVAVSASVSVCSNAATSRWHGVTGCQCNICASAERKCSTAGNAWRNWWSSWRKLLRAWASVVPGQKRKARCWRCWGTSRLV